MRPPKIGIVSGIGPLAGSDVLAKTFKNAAKLYGAKEDHEYPDLILLNHGINGIDNTGALSDSFEKEIVSMVQQLESAGCNIIGIACNTAHLYLDKIETKPETKLINLIDEVSVSAKAKGLKYLLLTSSTSRQHQLYQSYLNLHGVNFKATSKSQQQLLDQAIDLVMAYNLEKAGIKMAQVLASAKKQGYSAVIAGCTELPIAIANCVNLEGLEILDSNDELAKALLRNYYKKIPNNK